MNGTIRSFSFLILVAVALHQSYDPNIAYGDDPVTRSKIVFRSGNQISGEILTEVKNDGRSYVVVRTDSGSVLKLDKGKLIQRIVPFGTEQREYEGRIQQLQHTPGEHWKMYEWCRDKSRRSKFKEESLFHLKQIVKLDPSDEKAWRSFKSVDPDKAHTQVDGRWIPEQQHYRSIGYVKSNGNWIPEIQVDSNRQRIAQDDFLNVRKIALKKWKKHILPVAELEDVRAELFRIVDPVSVTVFAKTYLKKEKNPELRSLYLEAIGQVSSPAAHQILVQYAMLDEDRDVREQAILMLEQRDQYDPDATVRLVSQYLASPQNKHVNRAGEIIGRLNRESAIVPLIAALVTRHRVETGNEPGRLNTGFGNNGSSQLSTGGPKTVLRDFNNEDVRFALERITQRRFGFQKEVWQEWYVSEHTITNHDLRRNVDD